LAEKEQRLFGQRFGYLLPATAIVLDDLNEGRLGVGLVAFVLAAEDMNSGTNPSFRDTLP
jgi:hypothetical protein